MNKVLFAFGIHNHQPVGNFDYVFEDAYQKSYLPFLEILESHPKFRITLHYSGVLLDWLEENHADFIMRLTEMVDSRQIEMMSGAHYEPILVAIPDRDKVGQIEKLTREVRRHTGYDAKGMWMAERVWEPHLPKTLREAGVTYIILDDSHFKYAGLKEEELSGYYVTEEQGETLKVFPISERLRYTIPFQMPEDTLEYLRGVAARGKNEVAVFADDGEKFGVWPGTHEHVFKNGWLEGFVSALEKEEKSIEMVHFSEALERLPPKGRVYLPAASYREMMEWALPSTATRELEEFEQRLKDDDLFESYNIYVRGGFWRNFLAKYPESNHMHKKMLYVSKKIEDSRGSLPEETRKKALDYLWAGQCNCPYWHGVFGGLYLAHLRHAIYKNLIKAENTIQNKIHRKGVQVSAFDFSGNGEEDVVIESPTLNLYLDPSAGGSLVELDYKPAATNLMDTMSRREEAYHRKLLEDFSSNASSGEVASIHDLVISKEENLQQYLKYDWYLRRGLIDHFLAPGTTLGQFADCEYLEIGDFVDNPYEYEIAKEGKSDTVSLRRTGNLTADSKSIPLQVEKTLRLRQELSEIGIMYKITNLSEESVELHFGVEWNVGLLAGNAPDRYYEVGNRKLADRRLASKGKLENVKALALVDEWQNIRVDFEYEDPAKIWRFPVETVSLSEAGVERVFQSSVVFAHWQFLLNKEEQITKAFTCSISSVK